MSRIAPLILLGALHALLAAPSAAPAQEVRKLTGPRLSYPTYTPWGAILYESAVAGDWDIYEVTPSGMVDDGSTVTRLTESPSLDRTPSASPDGAHIAFISDRGGNYDVYRMNRDGTDVVRLTTTDEAEIHPYWSPDSRSIVYNARVPGERAYSIWMMDRDGRNQREVHRDSDLNSYAQISPDGRSLVFDKWWDNDESNGEIMLLDLESGELTRLTDNRVYDGYPAWFPDGRYILYSSQVDGVFKLFRISVAGGEPEQITFGPGDDQRGAVSADGTRIVFNRDLEGTIEIYEMTVPPAPASR